MMDKHLTVVWYVYTDTDECTGWYILYKYISDVLIENAHNYNVHSVLYM